MSIKTHIRMTASEIAMGRYMRAPDHPADDQAVTDEFAAAFESLAKDDPAPADAGGGENGADAATGGQADGAAAGDDSGDAGAGADGAAPAGDEGAADGQAADGAASKEVEAGEDKGAAAEVGGGGAEGAARAEANKPAKSAKEPPAAAGDIDTEAVLRRLAQHVKETDTGEPAPQPKEQQEPPLYTEEEQAKIAAFEKEWPDVAEAVDLRNKAFGRAILKYAFGEIMKEFSPIRDMVNELAARTHITDIKESVGEYTEQEVDEIVNWVKTQPDYLQTAMMGVIEQGTASEVADLVGRYREATGKAPPAKQEPSQETSGGDTELSGTVKQAAASLAPVSSKRSVAQLQQDPNDFDGAFARFADS